MGLFNHSVKIGEGQTYDTSSVSQDGVTQEESIKKKIKLKELFKAFDLNKDGTLDKMELAAAMDAFSHYDENGDEKLSKKELNEAARLFNEEHDLEGKDALKGKDLKALLKNIMNATKYDKKVSASGVLAEDTAKKADEQMHISAQNAVEEIELPEPVQLAVEKAPETFSYTVQNGDSFNGLIKRTLKQKGIENPTKEQIEEAKEEFKRNNPDAVRTNSNGVEYLLVGAKVKTSADLGDLNNADTQIGAYADAAQKREAAAQERKNKIARTSSLNIPNKTYNTYEDYAKALFEKEGIKPTDKEVQERIAELKKLNPNIEDGELLNKTIKTPVTEEFGTGVLIRQQERQDKKDLAKYTKTRFEADTLARKLFDICDNNIGAIGTKEFQEALKEVTPDNVVEVLNKYDEQASLHKGDTSLMDTIRSEMSDVRHEKAALTHILDTLSEAARKAGVSEDDIKTAQKYYTDSMNEQYASAHVINSKDMEKAVDFLRGAIEAKRQGKGVAEMSTTDAMKDFTLGEDGYTMVNDTAQTEYANARKEEGWTAKTGDWVCGLFGCNTIEDMDKKLGENAQGAQKLFEAAKNGDEAEFKKVYKDMFGIEFEEKKIAARNEAKGNLQNAYALDNTAKICSSIDTNADYDSLRAQIGEKFNIDDETIDTVIEQYKTADTQEAKKEALVKFIDETKSSSQAEFRRLSKGRSLSQMEKDFDLLTKSAYGTNDIVKDVVQFNENQQTTEMVTIAAAEIAGTIALQFVPGLGQMAAARLAVSAAKWGTRAVKVVNFANKAAKGFEVVDNFQTASRTAKVVTNMVNAGVSTATVNATTGKDAEHVLKKTVMNMSFAGVGSGSSILAPKIAQQFGISSKLATEIVEEALNAAGSAGIVTASGGQYGTNEALADFVTGMVIARISHIKTKPAETGVVVKDKPTVTIDETPSSVRQIDGPQSNNSPVPQLEVSKNQTTNTPSIIDHSAEGGIVIKDRSSTPEVVHKQPALEKPNVEPIVDEGVLAKATKDGNNHGEVAPKRTVGTLNAEKFAQVQKEVDEILKNASSPDDLKRLEKQIDALQNRDQRRILENKLKAKKDEFAKKTSASETGEILGNLNEKQWESLFSKVRNKQPLTKQERDLFVRVLG